MIPRLRINDIKVIGCYTGRIVIGLGLLMLIPMLVALFLKEWNPFLDYFIGANTCFASGLLLLILCFSKEELKWGQSLVMVSLSWLGAMLFGAIPLFLSGHWLSYLDACFDAMSGFATCGLTLIQDLNHLPSAHNMWRHLMMFIGGQGIMVVAVTLFVKSSQSLLPIYTAEAREERILPNVINTGRFIWKVSFWILLLGTACLFVAGAFAGMPAGRAFFHGLWITMAAWDTGGFTPQSQSIGYYHSLPLEIITMVIMMLGSFNFRLHYAIWQGKRREILRNIEIIVFVISVFVLLLLLSSSLAGAGIYAEGSAMFRRGFYQLISGHTGTGYMTISPHQFAHQWPSLAFIGVIIAMAISGSACSTAGGIKLLRAGIIFKAFYQDVKKSILPTTAVVVQKVHHIKDVVLEDKQVRATAMITLAFLGLYFLGTLVGVGLGYPLKLALFESVSAGANVGLSCGITKATMPTALKIIYIFQMWTGRLEFVSVFALLGAIIAIIKGK